MGITENFHDAEEATQSAFFAIARNIKKISTLDEKNIKVYVFKTAKNSSISILLKNKKINIEVVSANDSNLIDNETPDDLLINNETVAKLIKIIKELPETYRDILSYYYLAGYSAKEIAIALQKDVPTVKTQLTRAKKKFKEAIEEAGVYEKN